MLALETLLHQKQLTRHVTQKSSNQISSVWQAHVFGPRQTEKYKACLTEKSWRV